MTAEREITKQETALAAADGWQSGSRLPKEDAAEPGIRRISLVNP